MESKMQTPPTSPESSHNVEQAILAAAGSPKRPSFRCVHTPPASFHPGQPLSLSLLIPGEAAHDAPSAVHLYYRHVDQAERWLSVAMQRGHDAYSAAIPGSYTDSAFPLQYYFVLQRGADAAWLYPAFNATLSNQPYYAIWKRSGS